MTNSKSIQSTLFSAFVMACALAVTFVQPAAAQTAGNLQCNGCVGSKDIKNKSVKSSDIKDGQVKNQDLAESAVTGGKIADGAVGAADLSGNAVTGAKVSDGSLKAEDLMDEPGVDFVGGNQSLSLTGIKVVRKVAVTVPRAGTVVVSAHGWYSMPGATGGSATCTIGETTSPDLAAEMNGSIGTNGSVPFNGTRAFSVSAGTHTFRLVCFRSSVSAVSVNDTYITAMFFPTRY